ncbi:hypothetical protein N7486_003026 [Penicillium sp. IBT 16267x]|nr:hypothetical protein N7486_003026 [Penicillium sp. IBT 16267x]
MAGSQESMHAEACPAPATESMPEELSTPSSRNERPLPARPHALPPNAFSRAMEFFMPSQPSPSLSEADIIQDDFNLEDDDSDIDSAAPSLGSRLLLTDSNLGSSLSLAQYRDQWARNCQLAQPDPRPVTPDVLEPEVTIPSHQHQPHTVSASGNSDVAQRSRGQAHRVSSNWSYSSSPSRSIMPESFHRQQRGIFERLCNLPLLALTLATGTVAQKRRHA